MNKIVNLGSIVDTLKINATFNNVAYETKEDYKDEIIENEIINFNKKIDDLIFLKKQAMEIKNHDNQMRFVPVELDKTFYRVMASATNSYSVVLQNGDISIYLRKFSKKVKNPIVKVEFRAEYLAKCGYVTCVNDVQRLIVNEFITNPVYRVNEIHLATDIQGYEFSPLDFYRIRTLSRTRTVFNDDEKNSYFLNQRFTGMTFGKGDLMLRIYDKTAEINKNRKKGFIEVYKWQFHPDFDKNKRVWRIEGQIRREKLKELALDDFSIDSLEQVLNNIPSIWTLFVSRFVHKSLTNKEIQEQQQGFKYLKKGGIKIITPDSVRMRFNKASISEMWEAIQTFNGHVGRKFEKIEDIKKPEVEYVENAYKALISTTTKLLHGNFNTSSLVSIIHNANTKYFDKHGITIMDKARLNALDYLSSAKIYYERFGYVFDGFDLFEKDLVDNIKSLVNPIKKYDKYIS